jgi:nicotinamide mononucleotide (NMN) deamidase PncC
LAEFKVATEQLAAAAPVIAAAALVARSAQAGVASAAGSEGAFGAEPIGAVFAAMCARAEQAVAELQQTTETLSRNVGAAGQGYLNTERGIIPTYALHTLGGFQP